MGKLRQLSHMRVDFHSSVRILETQISPSGFSETDIIFADIWYLHI